MNEQQIKAEAILDEAAASISEEAVSLRRESEIASLSKSDIKDLPNLSALGKRGVRLKSRK